MKGSSRAVLFALTIDTEADNQWDHGAPLRTDNVGFWEPFQVLCDRYGIPPTYLVTSEIAADPAAQRLLTRWSADGRAEVGAHLHAWTTPPFRDAPGFRFNDSAHAFTNELPDDLLGAKLAALTGEIEDRLGMRPTAFRSGRFGFDARTGRALAELGYEVDSSVTPMTEWRTHRGMPGGGGPDFTRHSSAPFLLAGTGEEALLEVPVTIIPTYPWLRRSDALLRLYRSLPVRAVRRAFLRRWLSPQPVWLQPSPDFTLDDMKDAWDCQRNLADVAVMMFHSSELMPGGSPMWPTGAAVQTLYGLLDRFFAFIVEAGAVPVTLSGAARELRSSVLEVRDL